MTASSLEWIHLAPGRHRRIEEGGGAVEWAAVGADARSPVATAATSPLLAALLAWLNDVLNDDDRQSLKPYVPMLHAVDRSAPAERGRRRVFEQWLVDRYFPTWLSLIGTADRAAGTMPTVTIQSLDEVWAAMRQVRPPVMEILARRTEEASQALAAAVVSERDRRVQHAVWTAIVSEVLRSGSAGINSSGGQAVLYGLAMSREAIADDPPQSYARGSIAPLLWGVEALCFAVVTERMSGLWTLAQAASRLCQDDPWGDVWETSRIALRGVVSGCIGATARQLRASLFDCIDCVCGLVDDRTNSVR